MKRFLLALVSVVAVSAPALAQIALVRTYNCNNCHVVDRVSVGPRYTDIAKKFAGQSLAVDRIASLIVNGTGAMPPQTQVSRTTAREIAIWILSLKVN